MRYIYALTGDHHESQRSIKDSNLASHVALNQPKSVKRNPQVQPWAFNLQKSLKCHNSSDPVMAQDQPSIVGAIEAITTKYELCRNRVWEGTRSVECKKRDQFLQIPDAAKVEQTGSHEGHDQCTFDFCEHSRLDFTGVPQRHESCTENQCATKRFDTLVLEKAIEAGMPTAWKLAETSVIEPPQPYMAISHVWSDGTGAGAWPPGQVNQCLYDFFKKIAEQFQCEGIWWDTVCIPIGKAARSKAIVNIHRNYEDARITLVHDGFLRNWEWVSPEIACFAIIISPWFSRGWTALELAKSRKVKVIFKGPQGPVIKDLDEDILAKDGASPRHLVASRVIENLRQRGVAGLNGLLTVLGPRHTSWPRDVAIISGQLTGITIQSGASQQRIYQEILQKIGKISHGHLFHNSATMSKGFTWCPTNLFDIRQASTPSTLLVGKNGDVTGEWDVFPILDRFKGRYNWKDAHPLVEANLKESLKHRENHSLLVDPQDDLISRALLVKIMIDDGSKRVYFVGPVYFHPPPTRQEFGQMKTSQPVTITIVGAIVTEKEKQREAQPQTGRGDVENSKKSDLLSAATVGDFKKVRALQALGGFDPNICDEDGNTPLHLAAQNGHETVAIVLLKLMANLSVQNLQNKEGKTALHLAAQDGHDRVMEELLKNAADPNLEDKYTWTPLHYATWKCYPLLAQRLLRGGADKNFQDRFGQNALHLAAERGNVKIVSSLLSEGADLNAQCHDLQTALHRAAWGGSKEVVKLLLARAPNLNICDKDNRTALHIAAEKGQTSVVELLLDHHAVRETQDSMEQTALHLAAQNGHEAVVGLLLVGAQLELEDYNGLTPLLLAVKNGHRGVVGMLLGRGARVESRSGSGKTPLMWAAEKGHEEVVRLLLTAGADLTSVDSANQTPLLSAAENGHTEVVELLLQNGAVLNSKDSGGQTPLLWAAEKGHASVVKVLLQVGADPDTRDGNHQTPLLAATKNGYETVVKHLLERNVNLEARGEDGWTPLSWAAKTGKEAIARLLLDKGADIWSKDREGDMPLDIAADYEHEPVVRLLLKKGATLKSEHSGRILQWAARKGHAVTVGLLLDSGVGLESKGYGNQTALLSAAERGQDAVVKLLLDRGAKVWVKDEKGQTALSLAFYDESEAVLRVLLENGAKLDSRDQGGQILLWALKKKHATVARLALEKGAEPDAVDREGRTPLSWAAEKGFVEVVKILLQKRVNLEHRRDPPGFTPLVYAAAENEDTTVMKLLLQAGAQVVYKDKDQVTALQGAISRERPAAVELLLMKGAKIPGDQSAVSGWVLGWAASKGHWDVVKQLLNTGVDVEYKGGENRTALSWAAEAGNQELVGLLLDKGANSEAKDNDGQTPLFYAVGNIEVVKLMLARGANQDAKDKYGRTPLSRAEARGYKDVIRFLSSSQ